MRIMADVHTLRGGAADWQRKINSPILYTLATEQRGWPFPIAFSRPGSSGSHASSDRELNISAGPIARSLGWLQQGKTGAAHRFCAPRRRIMGEWLWRREPESNRPKRICNPLHNRFAIAPCPPLHMSSGH